MAARLILTAIAFYLIAIWSAAGYAAYRWFSRPITGYQQAFNCSNGLECEAN